ncbi:doublecortin domain-containing protein 2C [Muntiacus reevesi]|uniref:doublecortin domain-containing protein 2C n=1 Tax=Muntiacus reevesi TaxID=9886 RepID=UPI003307053A
MGSRAPHALVDTTPAKTIVVYRNGDQFYVGRKFVLSRRRVATFEALLEQLTEQVEVPFGVRRLFTPTRGCPVLELDSLQAGGKYVAAGRERFKKLDYINIVPRKPAKMRKLKEIKPVVHCGMNVPSRWQTFHRMSRQINVFTNGRLFIPPVKIIIPKFSLMEWNSVLATVGEKVFPLGGVRKLFTMNGHLLDNSKDLQDNHFYVAAGLEAFKNFPYWKSPKVPSEVQQKYTDMEKHSRRKKKEDPKVKDTRKQDSVSPKTQDSVFYAKEGKKKPRAEALIQSGADGDVFKAQTPNQETQGAPEVKEAPDVRVELPVDGRPADIVKDAEETHRHMSDFESNREQEDEKLYEDNERKIRAQAAKGLQHPFPGQDPLPAPLSGGSGQPLTRLLLVLRSPALEGILADAAGAERAFVQEGPPRSSQGRRSPAAAQRRPSSGARPRRARGVPSPHGSAGDGDGVPAEVLLPTSWERRHVPVMAAVLPEAEAAGSGRKGPWRAVPAAMVESAPRPQELRRPGKPGGAPTARFAGMLLESRQRKTRSRVADPGLAPCTHFASVSAFLDSPPHRLHLPAINSSCPASHSWALMSGNNSKLYRRLRPTDFVALRHRLGQSDSGSTQGCAGQGVRTEPSKRKRTWEPRAGATCTIPSSSSHIKGSKTKQFGGAVFQVPDSDVWLPRWALQCHGSRRRSCSFEDSHANMLLRGQLSTFLDLVA